MSLHLVLGGEKSGKSDFAMGQLLQAGPPACLLVTGRARDAGFREQVRRHKLSRPCALPVIETGIHLFSGIMTALQQGYANILADSLDFWLFACLDSGHENLAQSFTAQIPDLTAAARNRQAHLIFVSCEVSLGPIAADKLTRRFVRELGMLHQTLAQACATVTLVVAGLPLEIKKG